METSLNFFLKSAKLVDFANKIVNAGLKQAYLFESDDKQKNYAFCKMLSLLVNCKNKNMCLSCDSCQKILNNNSIDFFVYPKNNAILVDDINEIIESCYVLPFENQYKIYVLNDFDEANIASQNKFLKTLEEPPKNVIFLLNSTKSDMVLPTIRSRCTKIVLPKFEKEEIINLLKLSGQEISNVCLENSFCELGNYISLLEDNFELEFDFCLDMLKNMTSSSDILKYSSAILKNNNFESFYKALFSIFIDMKVCKISKDLLRNKSKADFIENLSESFSEKAIDEILNYLIDANKRLSFNTNLSLVVDCILIDILEEKHKWN